MVRDLTSAEGAFWASKKAWLSSLLCFSTAKVAAWTDWFECSRRSACGSPLSSRRSSFTYNHLETSFKYVMQRGLAKKFSYCSIILLQESETLRNSKVPLGFVCLRMGHFALNQSKRLTKGSSFARLPMELVPDWVKLFTSKSMVRSAEKWGWVLS